MVCVGSDDPFITAEARAGFEQEMDATDVDWQRNLYGGAEHASEQRRTLCQSRSSR